MELNHVCNHPNGTVIKWVARLCNPDCQQRLSELCRFSLTDSESSSSKKNHHMDYVIFKTTPFAVISSVTVADSTDTRIQRYSKTLSAVHAADNFVTLCARYFYLILYIDISFGSKHVPIMSHEKLLGCIHHRS